MPILGLRAWFPTTGGQRVQLWPAGARGSQIFFYQALEPRPYLAMALACSTCPSWCRAGLPSARHTTGRWPAMPRSFIEPREFPEYGEHYATYFLDPHGIMLEVVCHAADET